MTEIEDKFDWNKLAEKGDSYEEVRTALDALESSCCTLTKEEIYDQDNEFREDFKHKLIKDIAQMFENSIMTQKEITLMKKKFPKRIKKTLKVILLKNGLAQITFDQFSL